MNVDLIEIDNNVFHLVFPGRFSLCSTFCRFQEFYESPEFAGQVFTKRQFREWYKKSKKCNVFTYNYDWSGFNIPSTVLKPFFNGDFDPLSSKEQMFLDLFKNKRGRYYIIGTFRSSESHVLNHELAHGYWFVDSKYRAEAQKIIDSISRNKYEIFKKILQDYGYGDNVIDDEIHAYIATTTKSGKIFKHANIKIEEFSRARKNLRNLFNSISHKFQLCHN